jgi:hypothetical protein
MPAPVGEALAARGTLAVVGCSVPQIAAVTGHTLASVYSILAKHYLHRNPALAQSAIRRLERITKLPTARRWYSRERGKRLQFQGCAVGDSNSGPAD